MNAPVNAPARILAERQMGEFLKAMPKQNGTPVLPDDKEAPPKLREIGITYTQSHRAQKLADIPADEFRERIAAVAGRQLPLALPARNVDDVLRERLGDRAAQLRVSAHAGERLELEHEVADLRRLIAKGRSS